jgi:ubiquinone/menaquinone biosynthesis C-methylase UbiE
MLRRVDALTSSTLKHLREQWWDDAFTAFVKETLQPRPGRRILDIGCGTGTAEVQLSRLRLTQVELFAVDILAERVSAALAQTRAHNMSAHFAAADACKLPFGDASFDSVFCVAVLQHIGEVANAVAEMARVARPGGRVVVVEPDNAARFFYSSVDEGRVAHDAASRFFSALAQARGDTTDPSVGPHLATLFTQHEIELLNVELFPVSGAKLGAPADDLWNARRASLQAEIDRAPDEAIRRLGHDYLKTLNRYASAATAAGPAFVEIQNTLLFATVGQRKD